MMRPGWLRHDGREHRERAVVERRGAERHLRAVEVDVVAGTQLGQAALTRPEALKRSVGVAPTETFVERDPRPLRLVAKRRQRLRFCCATSQSSCSDVA